MFIEEETQVAVDTPVGMDKRSLKDLESDAEEELSTTRKRKKEEQKEQDHKKHKKHKKKHTDEVSD